MTSQQALSAPEVLLLVDDQYIGRKIHVAREFHEPGKHPGNPILHSGQEPWDRVPLLFGSVRHDPRAGRYRSANSAW